MSNHNNQSGSSRNRGGRRPYKKRNNQRPPAPPKPTFGQKLLQILTFGLAGKPSARAGSGRPASSPRRSTKQANTRRRPTPPTEVTSAKLYVGNLNFDATEEDLEELFKGVGTVQSAEIVINRHTQRSKGFGFVEMISMDEAKRAVETLHNNDFMGRPLIVNGAKTSGPKQPTESASS